MFLRLPQQLGGTLVGLGPPIPEPGHQYISGVGCDGQQRMIAKPVAVAVVAYPLLNWAVGMADGGVQSMVKDPATSPAPVAQARASCTQPAVSGDPSECCAARSSACTSPFSNSPGPRAYRYCATHRRVYAVTANQGVGPVRGVNRAQAEGQGGGKHQPGIGHKAGIDKGDLLASGVLKWQHPKGALSLGSIFRSKAIILDPRASLKLPTNL